jgi:hypothetical protein
MLNIKKHYNLRMFLNTLSLLDSFQIIPHVYIIYLKHCYANTLRKFTTLIYFNIKT